MYNFKNLNFFNNLFSPRLDPCCLLLTGGSKWDLTETFSFGMFEHSLTGELELFSPGFVSFVKFELSLLGLFGPFPFLLEFILKSLKQFLKQFLLYILVSFYTLEQIIIVKVIVDATKTLEVVLFEKTGEV